ncbi:hypothetical protein [Kutzneria buriramensis]|uniref:Lipoprotein n=1 Tax=Kutzneria buriramensis TaxID=1045776 RepID=A0A3E0I916_9PSEU|nr:hypothetical protein [Kutzneria buriramensis]REH55150.1 hypothetical protein BCF44_101166 [Kutzneria buriramensis]
MADGRVIALAALALAASALAGCTVAGTPQPSPDPGLVSRYFTDLDAAAAQGVRSEQQFLTSTQVPAFADRVCDLNGVTITATPTLATLRPDPGWTVPGSDKRPSGSVYVVAVSLTIRQGNSVVGTQIGSQRVVVDGGRAYGFAPCPAQ